MIPKFRAFVANKKMFDVDGIDFYDKTVEVAILNDTGEYLASAAFSFDDVKLMQSTGFNVNGEIYDQDIVFDPHSQTTGVVKWDEEGCRWVVETIEAVSTTESLSDWGTDITVIGNLFENPELVEVE